jgi:hypothetical protein
MSFEDLIRVLILRQQYYFNLCVVKFLLCFYCNNLFILSLIIFFLTWIQQLNSHK